MNRNSKVDRVEGFVMGTIGKRWLRVLVMSCGAVTACYGQAKSTQKQGPITVLREDCGGYAALVDEKKDCLVTADLACGELWKVQRDLLREIELRRYRVLSGLLSMLEVRLRKVRARGNASDPNLLAATRPGISDR
ncbi:MAG: hypothetical protein CSA62_01505 [Planctomycetota bacterium]|nr:MAG: hypothetical protein CSA62_01505 [Planctomycetota bacterium]